MRRTRMLTLAIAAVVIMAAFGRGPVLAVGSGGSGRYIVVLRDGSDATTAAQRIGATPSLVYSSALDGYAAELTGAQLTRVRNDPQTWWVQADASYTLGLSPVSSVSSQNTQAVSYGVKRVGGLSSNTADIDGKDDRRVDVDVAIIDTGVQLDHPDLNVVGGVDCTSGNGYGDEHGHGTMVGGFVGAIDNSYGRVGVAPGARLWSVRVLNKQAVGSDAKIICGIDWVTAHVSTIEIANMSLGGPDRHLKDCRSKTVDALHEAACRSVAAGVTYVVGAGNESSDASSFAPAWYPEVITASGLTDTDGEPGGLGGPVPSGCGLPNDHDDNFATFSNHGAPIDIAAPATCIGSTYIGSTYAIASGTSLASPLVAGGAALFVSTHPGASPAQVRTALHALQEPGPIPGDPDPYPEGVLNVSRL